MKGFLRDIYLFFNLPCIIIDLMASETLQNDNFYQNKLLEFYKYSKKRKPKFPLISENTHGVSLCHLPKTFPEYFMYIEASARRNFKKAKRKGYVFSKIDFNDYIADIKGIRLSSKVRQGELKGEIISGKVNIRKDPPSTTNIHDYPCFGVLKDGKLFAYASCLILGEIGSIMHILGHARFQNDGIVPMLIIGIADSLLNEYPNAKYYIYSTHFGSSTSMRRFKRKFKFLPHKIIWILDKNSPDLNKQSRKNALRMEQGGNKIQQLILKQERVTSFSIEKLKTFNFPLVSTRKHLLYLLKNTKQEQKSLFGKKLGYFQRRAKDAGRVMILSTLGHFARPAPPLKPDILLFSTRRGGSTWLTQLLNTEAQTKRIITPYDTIMSPNHYKKYILPYTEKGFIVYPSETEKEYLFRYFDDLCSGKRQVNTQWRFWSNDFHLRYNRIIFTFHYIKNLIRDFHTRYQKKIVYQVRHPIAVMISVSQRNWFNPFDAFANNQAFREAELDAEQNKMVDHIRNSGTRLEHYVCGWFLENHISSRESVRSEWLTLRYEEMVMQPEKTIELLKTQLDLRNTSNMMQIYGKPSFNSFESAEKVTRGDKLEMTENWRQVFDEKAHPRMTEIFSVFKNPHYPEL